MIEIAFKINFTPEVSPKYQNKMQCFRAIGIVPEDVALAALQDLEGDGAVVVLERRDVVVAHGQLGARIDLQQ